MVFNLFYILVFLFSFQSSLSERLLGVTVKVPPYLYVKDNVFRGYCVDVMDEISKIAGFNYSLYVEEHNRHGDVSITGQVSGLLAEVFNNASQFGIADLTVTEERKRYVDFTLPIMRLGVSALIHTTNAVKIKKFQDLSKQTHILYGVVKGGRILKRFYESTDETYTQMYYKMIKTNSLANNKSDGIRRAKISEYAFIQESADNEFIASNDCDLTSIRDTNDYFPTEYAIALPKGSPYLSKFNFAIRKMQEHGDFDMIKAKHWKGICNSAKSLLDYHNWFLLIFIILFSLILIQTHFLNH